MKEGEFMSVPAAESVSEKPEPDKLNALVKKIAEKRDTREVSLEKILIDLEANCSLPEGVAEMISSRVAEIRDVGANGEVLRKTSKFFIIDALASYYDDRIGIANFNFFKEELLAIMEEILAEEKSEIINRSDRVAMIFFDIDGLKSVNEYALKKHAAGDLLLQKSADIFNDGKTINWLQSMGVRFQSSRRSGDEFMLSLKADFPLSEKMNFVGVNGESVTDGIFVDYVIEKIQEEFRSADMSEVQDFSDPKQKEVYRELGFDVNKWSSDFKFRTSISGGKATLRDALYLLEKSENAENIGYEELLAFFLEKMINISDNALKKNKESDKEKRNNSKDRYWRIMESIYRSGRSDEEKIRALEGENNALMKRVAQLEEMLKRAQGQKEAE